MKNLRNILTLVMATIIFCCYGEILPEEISNQIKVEVVCKDRVSVEHNFQVQYKVKYEDPDNIGCNFFLILDREINKHAKLLYFAQTNSSTSRRIINGKADVVREETWVATFKPVKKGKFVTPGYTLVANPTPGPQSSFNVDIVPESKTIQIVALDKLSDNDGEKEKGKISKKEIKKLEKSGPVFLKIDLPVGEYVVGEPIRAKVFLFQKKVDIPIDLNVSQVFVNTKIKIKNADYKFVDTDDLTFEPMTYDGINYLGARIFILEITPLKPGLITIPKLKAKVDGRIYESDGFRGKLATQPISIKTETSPIQFNVTEKKSNHSKASEGDWL